MHVSSGVALNIDGFLYFPVCEMGGQWGSPVWQEQGRHCRGIGFCRFKHHQSRYGFLWDQTGCWGCKGWPGEGLQLVLRVGTLGWGGVQGPQSLFFISFFTPDTLKYLSLGAAGLKAVKPPPTGDPPSPNGSLSQPLGRGQ